MGSGGLARNLVLTIVRFRPGPVRSSRAVLFAPSAMRALFLFFFDPVREFRFARLAGPGGRLVDVAAKLTIADRRVAKIVPAFVLAAVAAHWLLPCYARSTGEGAARLRHSPHR